MGSMWTDPGWGWKGVTNTLGRWSDKYDRWAQDRSRAVAQGKSFFDTPDPLPNARANRRQATIRGRAVRGAKKTYGSNYGTRASAPGADGIFGGGTPSLPPVASTPLGANAPVTPEGGMPPAGPLGPGGSSMGGGAATGPVADPYTQAGMDAIARVNAIYGNANASIAGLGAQQATAQRSAQDSLARDLMLRYADLSRAVTAGNADMAAQGYGSASAPAAQAGELQLQALQNAGNSQSEYARRMAEMSQLNVADRQAGMAQAQAALTGGIWGDVAAQQLAAAQAAAAGGGGGGGGFGGGGGGASAGDSPFGPGSLTMAEKIAELMNPSNPFGAYQNWVATMGYSRKKNPKLWELQKRLDDQANPDALLATLPRGKKGKRNARQRDLLKKASDYYSQASQAANKQGLTWDDIRPFFPLVAELRGDRVKY